MRDEEYQDPYHDPCMNYTALLGRIGKFPPRTATVHQDKRTAFTLVCEERGRDGRMHPTYVDCECWGREAEQVGALRPGTWVVFEGACKRIQRGDAWKLVMSGHRVQEVPLDGVPA